MRTLAVLSRKGGAGKTTLAVHLAVAASRAGLRTLVADTDPQRSAVDWRRQRRAEGGPEVIEAKAGALFSIQQAAARSGVQLLVIDTPPTDDEQPAQAAHVADLCLVVARPGYFDGRAVARSVDTVIRARKPGVLVLNQAPAARSGVEPPVVRGAMAELARHRILLAPERIRQRADYGRWLEQGLTAMEQAPQSAAARETEALWGWLEPQLLPANDALSATPTQPAWPMQRAG